MARAYRDDLRRKLLEAHDAGNGTLAELVDRFGVSLAWAWKISSARKRTGCMERALYRPGAKARVDREAVGVLLERKPDLYLRELQAELEAVTGVRVSTPHLWKIARTADLPGLPRSLPLPQAEARGCGRHGQPQFPQGRRGAGEDRCSRGRVPLPAALLARPEPHRKSLQQTQRTIPIHQGQNRSSTRRSTYRTPPHHLSTPR
jgi:transposase